jgi:hypothetical protein
MLTISKVIKAFGKVTGQSKVGEVDVEHGTRLAVVIGYSVKINETENCGNEGRRPRNGVNLTKVGGGSV